MTQRLIDVKSYKGFRATRQQRIVDYFTTTVAAYGVARLLPDVASTVTFHLPTARRDALHVTRVLPSEQTNVFLIVPFVALTE